jgi:DNA-binding NarL/FixJ family response regulator
MHPIRTAIIEDDAPFAHMFEDYFKRRGSGILCVAVYPDGETALQKLPADPPEVALVDINMPGMDGIEFISRIRVLCPSVICLVLTTFDDDTSVFEALKAGACGYLLKRSAPDEIVSAIEQAMQGGAPMSPYIARQVVGFFHTRPEPDPTNKLSDRERQIIELLATGLLYKEIAKKLDLTFETVRSYVKRIYEKLHAHSRTEAVHKYQKQRR